MSLVVMMIWVGVTGSMQSGAAATIQGFPSIAACQAAEPEVHRFYDGTFYKAQTKCADLAR